MFKISKCNTNKYPCRVFKLMLFLPLMSASLAQAQAKKTVATESDVSTEVVAHDGDAIFSSQASFTFSVKNRLDAEQSGTLSYLVTTEKGERVAEKRVNVNIGAYANKDVDFDVPPLAPGFYKINFMINVSDYDDTTIRAFGIRPKEIQSQYARPADFDEFWQKAKDDLAKVKPNFKLTPVPKKSTSDRNVFEIQMQSLDNYTIRGWLTVPKTKNPHRKFAVLLGLPGYQVDLDPIVGSDDDLAIITLNTRGQGTSRGPIDTRRDEFISYKLEDKDRYVMRGVIMDCVRAIDFVYSQPNLIHDNILVSGGSMGGYLALAVAGVDKRVNLCSAQNPILCDIRGLVNEVDWPITSIKKYVATQPGLTLEKALSNLDYYDGKNFAQNINCSTLVGIGLLDPFAPPNNEYATFNLIPGKKKIMVFKNLGHEISGKYKEWEGRWMRDTFALF